MKYFVTEEDGMNKADGWAALAPPLPLPKRGEGSRCWLSTERGVFFYHPHFKISYHRATPAHRRGGQKCLAKGRIFMLSGRISRHKSRCRKINRLIISAPEIHSAGSKRGFGRKRRHSRAKTTCCVGQNNVLRWSKLHVAPARFGFRAKPESTFCRGKVMQKSPSV